MYHPTRGGVRGGRDQFTWEDVKVDKHRENYLGHSVKAPVGRWQKGKDLVWYTRDKNSADSEAAKEEIRRIKEDEEQAMREALGLAPKRANRLQGSRLDKHEFSELVKRGSTAEELGAGHAEAAQVQGLGFSRAPRAYEESGTATLQPTVEIKPSNMTMAAPASAPTPSARDNEESDEESSRKKQRREEKKREKRERREEKRERRESRHSEDRRSGKKERREKRRHDSD